MHWGASWSRVEDAIRSRQANPVGLSCMLTPYYEPAYEAARLARKVIPRAHVLLGGQHSAVAHPHALTESPFDALVLDEVEATIVRLADRLASGHHLAEVPDVAFRCGARPCDCPKSVGQVQLTPRARWLDDLDAIPRPAVDLLDLAAYDHIATLTTSSGCQFSSSFCTVQAIVGKAFRALSPDDVADEIAAYVQRHGIRHFFIEDDDFTFHISRVRHICSEIRRKELDVELHLPNGMTVVKLTDGLADSMADAGFTRLFLGIESTDVARMRAMREGFTSLPKVRDGASLFGNRGVNVGASLIVGLSDHPPELCRFTGDVIGAAVSLYVGRPYGAEPRSRTSGNGCAIALHDEPGSSNRRGGKAPRRSSAGKTSGPGRPNARPAGASLRRRREKRCRGSR